MYFYVEETKELFKVSVVVFFYVMSQDNSPLTLVTKNGGR